MTNTYLFAGASSLMALKCAELLQAKGHHVIGLSTKENAHHYNEFYCIEKYEKNYFPEINKAIDGIVYFPGTINLKPFQRFTMEEFTNDYHINTFGAASFAQAYLPQLKQSTKASIVFVSTVAVQIGMPFHASIAMAKGAIEGLTRALAAELAPSIRVNCIAPSLTNTPLAERFTNTPEKMEASEKRNPLKKVGTPEELAPSIVFLLSEQATWITGQILAVDGGMGVLKNIKMEKEFTLNDILGFEKRYRATFINSLGGFKSVALIGTINKKGITNLAIFNSFFHLGASPPLFGFIIRTDSVERHTLTNILEAKQFTVNHIKESFYKQAHQTSARYDSTSSEFEATGLTAEYKNGYVAPFVKESPIKIAAELVKKVDVIENGTILIIAQIQHISVPQDCVMNDGFIDLTRAGTIACSGLDTYYNPTKIARLSYAKPDVLINKIINTQ